MTKLTRDSLMTLEAYAKLRNAYRAEVIAHKKARNIALGDHLTLMFEDEMTMRYQVQEMLRAEKIFEEEGIQEELDSYNPLIPDGSNWKATMLIEYEDIEQRRIMLNKLVGLEDRVWVRVAGLTRVYAIADEDLERATEQKTSAVHFLRFELSKEMVLALKQGASLSMGVDHPKYLATLDPVPSANLSSLLNDLQD